MPLFSSCEKSNGGTIGRRGESASNEITLHLQWQLWAQTIAVIVTSSVQSSCGGARCDLVIRGGARCDRVRLGGASDDKARGGANDEKERGVLVSEVRGEAEDGENSEVESDRGEANPAGFSSTSVSITACNFTKVVAPPFFLMSTQCRNIVFQMSADFCAHA